MIFKLCLNISSHNVLDFSIFKIILGVVVLVFEKNETEIFLVLSQGRQQSQTYYCPWFFGSFIHRSEKKNNVKQPTDILIS